jgi:hypothetical protein
VKNGKTVNFDTDGVTTPITLINGRIKSKLGQSRTLAFANFNEAFDSFCQQVKIRHQRGYHLKTFDCDNHPLLLLLLFLVHAEGIFFLIGLPMTL